MSGLVLAVDESYEESHWLPLALGHTLRMVLFLWPTTRHPFSALRISRKTLAPGAIAGCSMQCPVLLVPLLLSYLVAGAALLSAHLNENSGSLSSGAAIQSGAPDILACTSRRQIRNDDEPVWSASLLCDDGYSGVFLSTLKPEQNDDCRTMSQMSCIPILLALPFPSY